MEDQWVFLGRQERTYIDDDFATFPTLPAFAFFVFPVIRFDTQLLLVERAGSAWKAQATNA